MKILIIDDDPVIAQNIKEIIEFKNKDDEVFLSYTGKDGLNTVKKENPDIVFLDLKLPDCNGKDLLKDIIKFNDLIGVIIITGNADIKDAIYSFSNGASDFILKTTDLSIIYEKIKKVYNNKSLLLESRMYHEVLKEEHTLAIKLKNIEIEDAQNQLKESYDLLKKTLDDSIKAMAKIVEFRDSYTAGHQDNVRLLSNMIADKLEVSSEMKESISIAAQIHDIGKIGVPAELLSKPSQLTSSEFELIKDHVDIGYKIVNMIEFPYPIAEIIRQHHEKIDGTGYPLGLKGDEIKFEAKIISVADILEAIIMHRPYRPGLSLEMAKDILQKNKGKCIDEKIADVAIKICDDIDLKKMLETKNKKNYKV